MVLPIQPPQNNDPKINKTANSTTNSNADPAAFAKAVSEAAAASGKVQSKDFESDKDLRKNKLQKPEKLKSTQDREKEEILDLIGQIEERLQKIEKISKE
jgi:hypothetical protein